MGRIVGGILILCGCAGLLMCWMEKQKKKQEILAEWIRLLLQWEHVLKEEQLRLYDFFCSYAGMPQTNAFLKEVCACMDARDEPDGRILWRKSLVHYCRQFPKETGALKELLQSAADAFYGDSMEENLHGAQCCRKRMEAALEEARAEYAKKRRVYMPAGMLSGVIMIILLV